MISKIFVTGKSFGESCQYVCQGLERAQILEAEGVRTHDLHLMEQDFETQRKLANQLKEKPVFHGVLSFPHGEDPGDRLMVEIGRRWLEEILANRVSNTGAIVGEGLVIERGIKAARKLTEEFRLRPEQGKDLRQTNRQALHEPDAQRYRLYETIKELLPKCQRMEDLEKGLLERGISMRYRIDRESGARQGISFRIENYAFKGSEVDRAYSLKGLERALELQQKQAMEQKRALEQAEKERQEQAQRQTEAQRQTGVQQQTEVQRQERQQERLRQGPRLHF